MYLFDNPVLQRELLRNLRMRRAFVLLLVYLGLLCCVVLVAWPERQYLDMVDPQAAKRLVNMFFLGQYMLASLMAPSFAAGSITGEKERKTYEMLLASPLKPGAIILGKWLAALCHLAILIFASLPIVMLCLPLGGVSFYEVLAAYFALIVSVCTFGMISLACSSYFNRTVSSLVVAYLLILPLALLGVLVWNVLEARGQLRLGVTLFFLPLVSIIIGLTLFMRTSRRLLHPPDVGSGGEDVVDLETESREAIGLYIQRDQFPDRLFVPPKREGLLEDGTNPVYDKELRSELFAQGTLMVRVVIQVSLLLAFPLIAVCLFWYSEKAPWYVGYALLFNMLIGPVFSAGSVTGERERQTLDLLLTTTISPGKILWGKLVTGLRVSGVLTSFLMWPMLLACLLVPEFWPNLLTMAGYFLVVLLSCLTTATVAMFCSVLFRRTATSLMVSYMLIATLYGVPPLVTFFTSSFPQFEVFADSLNILQVTSPFSAALNLPLDLPEATRIGNTTLFTAYVALTIGLNCVLMGLIAWLFNTRWRVAT